MVKILTERAGPSGVLFPRVKGVSLMANPNVGILEEISDQKLDAVSAAGQGTGTILSSLACYGASYVLGNNGNFCTATAECQKNCK